MPSQRNIREVQFGGERLWLDPAAAVYLPDHQTLIVSDLHLEKGSFLGQTGAPVPLYDTLDTLLRLQNLLNHYKPQQVVLLGDTFHDRSALKRLPEKERGILHTMATTILQWHWVSGNHDVDVQIDLPGQSADLLKIGNLNLSHEPVANTAPLIVGHFHPKIVTHVGGHKVKGKVFMQGQSLLILPSFGSYTGGLLTTSPVFKTYLEGNVMHYLIMKEKIFKLS